MGGHVRVRVFMGPHEHALGMCGNLTVRASEWDELLRSLSSRSNALDVIVQDDGSQEGQ